jgi:hypothetical protein
MMLFRLYQFAGEFQSGPDIFNGDRVFFLHFLKTHTSSEAADDLGNRHPGALDNRFPMADLGIDSDPLVHKENLSLFNRHVDSEVLTVVRGFPKRTRHKPDINDGRAALGRFPEDRKLKFKEQVSRRRPGKSDTGI